MSSMRFALAAAALFFAMLPAAPAIAQDAQGNKLWKDFIHYARIARMDLAAANGKALLRLQLSPDDLLAAIEDSRYAKNYTKDLARMKQMSGENAAGIADVAKAVEKAIDDAKIAVVRNPNRIAEEIQSLDGGLRERLIAIRRLGEAGEYATPQLIEVIIAQTAEQKKLRPYAIQALTEIGRPVVLPLCEALQDLPAPAKQDIARVLGQIGYPMSMPYLKAAIENEKTDAASRTVLKEALASIAATRSVDADASAAKLFYLLGEDYYADHESLTLEPEAETNLLWYTDDRGELRYLRVPTEVYTDAMAMRAAKRALSLDSDLGDALSLWIAANFRRENHLPAGAIDPSYGDSMRSPQFYAWSAGPTYVEPVLARAISDRDANLALDAIEALARTAGNGVIAGQAEPLLTALRYPDRRVRYEAAMAIAAAKPTAPFIGSGGVVPVLAEAVRQGNRPVALVVAEAQSDQNTTAGTVRAAGDYDVVLSNGSNLGEVLLTQAGVDVVVVRGSSAFVNSFAIDRAKTYKISAAPMIVLAADGDEITAARMLADDATAFVTKASVTQQQFNAQLGEALTSAQGAAISAEQAEAYATSALMMMRDLAISGSDVFDISLANQALIEALGDERDSVAAGAGAVLGIVGGEAGQQALLDAALDAGRTGALRVSLLGSLAECARAHGAMITQRQADLLRRLVSDASGDLADAAAAAYGALEQPSSRTTALIVE